MVYSSFSKLVLLLPTVLLHGYEVGLDSHSSHASFASHEQGQASKKTRLMRTDPHNTVSASPATENLTVGKPLPEPVNFVINCPGDVNRLARFRKHMEAAGLTFEVFPCVKLTKDLFKAAREDGYFGPLADRGDLRSTGALGVALAHMKLLHLIQVRQIPAANIFEDDEVVFADYHKNRQKVLAHLPGDTEFVNLNAEDARGEPVPGADGKLLKMGKGIPQWSNIWLSNYFVSLQGAKKMLSMLRHFDLGPTGDMQIDWLLVDFISSGCSMCLINAYSYTTNVLSMHCENFSMKEKLNKIGMNHVKPDGKAMSLVSRDDADRPTDPMCREGNIEGQPR